MTKLGQTAIGSFPVAFIWEPSSHYVQKVVERSRRMSLMLSSPNQLADLSSVIGGNLSIRQPEHREHIEEMKSGVTGRGNGKYAKSVSERKIFAY